MVRSFRHKGLRDLFLEDRGDGIRPDLVERRRHRLSALNEAQCLEDLRVPGFDLHRLHGRPVRHAISVNGPWRITFEWEDSDARRVDMEQYH